MSTQWGPGEIIAERWEVKQVLRGGMGVVYVVHDQATGERLAAKSYRRDILNSQVIARFTDEATTWLNIPPHPNIVRARYYRVIEDTPLLFLEFAKDGSLHERLERLGHNLRTEQTGASRFDRLVEDYARLEMVIRNFAIQFCDGMIHACKHGVVAHRDIKPANCLLERNVLKISDFGLAKSLDMADLGVVRAIGRRQLRAMLVGWSSFDEDAERLRRFLGSRSYDIVEVAKIENPIRQFAGQLFDLILLKACWDVRATLDRIREIDREIARHTPVIVVCSRGTETQQRSAQDEFLHGGADQCVCSPSSSAKLFRAIDMCHNRQESPGLTGEYSPEMHASCRMWDPTPSMTVDWETLDVVATGTGLVAGTPTHMAPEQFRGLRRADVRSDIYSFGVMLYQMCNGSLPFSANNVVEYRERHSFSAPPDLGTAFEHLNEIVARCMSKNPDYRFCDFEEIRSELDESIFDPTAHEGEFRLVYIPPPCSDNSQCDDPFELAHSQIMLRDYGRALATLTEISRSQPRSGRVWREMGLLLMNQLGRRAEALECLERATHLGENVEADIAKCRDMQW